MSTATGVPIAITFLWLGMVPRKGLQSRHITIIALGGAIGTGLFVAFGASRNEIAPTHRADLAAMVATIG